MVTSLLPLNGRLGIPVLDGHATSLTLCGHADALTLHGHAHFSVGTGTAPGTGLYTALYEGTY